jgi:hypothetical protein
MSVAHLLVGIAALAVGVVCAVGRKPIVARQRQRFTDRPVQAPMLYLVLGALLILVGITQIVLAFA